MTQSLSELMDTALSGKKQAAAAAEVGMPESTFSEVRTLIKKYGDKVFEAHGLKVVSKDLSVFPKSLVDALLTTNQHFAKVVTADHLEKGN